MTKALHVRTNEEWLRDLSGDDPAPEAVGALQTLLRKSLARVLRSRGNLNESDLDDFSQDAILRVLQSLASFRGDSRFTTWATAVAIRVAFTALRRRGHHQQSLDDADSGSEALTAGPENERDSDEPSVYSALERAISDSLTERQRQVILGELGGVPTSVLVEQLGTNLNAFYKLNYDARQKLKQALNQAGFSDEDVRLELARESESA